MSSNDIAGLITAFIIFALFGRYWYRLYFQGDYPKADKPKKTKPAELKPLPLRFDDSQENRLTMYRHGKQVLSATLNNGRAFIYETGNTKPIHKMSYPISSTRRVEKWMEGYKKEEISKPEKRPVYERKGWRGLRPKESPLEIITDS